AFATLGSKVRIPSDAALAFLCNVGLEDDPSAAALGHLVYGQRELTNVPVRFSVSRLKGRRSFVFARAGYGKSNLIKYLCSFLPQRLQRAAPSDNLVEHFIDRLLMPGIRLEDAEVFKVAKQGQQDLVANRCDLQLGQHQAQLFNRARTAGTAIADEAGGLVVPFSEQKIDRVLECTRDTMIIFGRHEDVAIE